MAKHIQANSVYSNVTSGRAIQTSYTNTGDTPRTVVICVTTVSANPIVSLYIDGQAIHIEGGNNTNANQIYTTLIGVIPPGKSYLVFPNAGTWYVNSWFELQ